MRGILNSLTTIYSSKEVYSRELINYWHACDHIKNTTIFMVATITFFNLLKKKRRLLYLKTQFVPRCKHFQTRL